MNTTQAEEKKINVGFILTSLPVGGQERVLLEVLRRLNYNRFRAHVYCLKGPGQLAGEVEAVGIKVCSGFISGKWDLRVLRRLVRQMHQDKIDVVDTIGEGDAMFWGRLAAKLAGVRAVISEIHCTRNPQGQRVISRLNHLFMPLTDRFVAVGYNQKAFLVSEEGLPENKTVVIHNGVDLHKFSPDNVNLKVIRDELGVASSTQLVGIVAVLRPEKAHSVFLEAAKIILRQCPDTLFLVVGDGPEKLNIEKQATELGISNSIRLLGSRTDVLSILVALDVAVLCSDCEAFSVAILEYMASGKPVVSTRVGSVEELVDDGITGLLVPPQSPVDLAEGVLSLLNEPEKARSMGLAGRKKVVELFGVEKMVRARENIYENLLQQKKSARRRSVEG